MATNNKEQTNGHDHSCEQCAAHGGFHKFFVLRWVLAILILLTVLYVGIKIGEFKGYFESSIDGYGSGYNSRMMNGNYPGGMMRYWNVQTDAPSDTTTTTPKTPVKK